MQLSDVFNTGKYQTVLYFIPQYIFSGRRIYNTNIQSLNILHCLLVHQQTIDEKFKH